MALSVAAQPRPVLLNPKRHYLAGHLVFIPADMRFESFALPRQLAQIADHELLTPPRQLLTAGQSAALNEWARAFAFAESDGLLVAVDQLETATLREIRTRHRHLLIYGFSSQAGAQALLDDGTLDFLLIGNTVNAASLLLARWMNQRFGYAPTVAPLFSADSGRALAPICARNIAALRGKVVTLSADTPNADLRLYLHAPQTNDEQRALLIKAVAANVAGGVRVAIVDAADSAEERAALLRQLRQNKLLDRVTAYAAVNAHAPEPAAACQRALTQAGLWLTALRFLRDDRERLRRIERAQIAALLNSYLREAIYPTLTLDTAGSVETREARALDALRPQAVTLFNEQFRRNLHTLLLNTGERAEFEVNQLQRVQVRLDETQAMPEVRTDVYLVLLGTFLARSGLPRAAWELDDENLDIRLLQRYDAIPWQTFKTDRPTVVLSLKYNKSGNEQGYTINSRRAGEARRIQINAASVQGAFYALAQLEHLGASGQLAQDFQFNETPAIAERGFREAPSGHWSHRDRLAMLRLAGRARLNAFVYTPPTDWRAQLTADETVHLRELLQTAQANFVTLVYAFNFNDTVPESDFGKLTTQLRALHRLGVTKFLLLSAKPESIATLTQRTRQWMQTQLPAAQLLTSARWQWRLCATTPLGAWTLPVPPTEGAGVIACVTDGPHAAQLPLAWLGAHVWSGKTLSQATALSTTLNWLYDEKARAVLAPWVAAFANQAQPSFTNALAGLFDVAAPEINAPVLSDHLARLSAALPQLATTREQGLLRGELLAFLQRVQQRLEQIQNDTNYERIESGAYRRRNP